MSSRTEVQAATVTPPTSGTTVGLHNTAIATETTSRTYDLSTYTNLFDKYIDLKADGGTIYVSFDNDSTGSIDQTVKGTASAATALADGTTEAVPWPIVDGETLPCILTPTKNRYLHVKAATGTPVLRIRPSSPKVT